MPLSDIFQSGGSNQSGASPSPVASSSSLSSIFSTSTPQAPKEPVKEPGIVEKAYSSVKSFLGFSDKKPVTPPAATSSPLSSIFTPSKETPQTKSSIPLKGIFEPSTAPKSPSYFSTTTPSGATIGSSEEKDISGKPFFAYRNPGDTSTTTDKTRVASTFDPRVAQPLSHDEYYNPRAEGIRKQFNDAFGIEPSQQLDHAIALTVGGSNDAANLRAIPTAENQKAGQFEMQLADKLKKGEISYFDAQVADAKYKGIKIPWTPEQKKNGIAQMFEDTWNSVKDIVGVVDKGTADSYKKVMNTISGAIAEPDQSKIAPWNKTAATLQYLPSAIAENLPFGIGDIIKTLRSDPETARTLNWSDVISGLPEAGKDTLKAFVAEPALTVGGFLLAPFLNMRDSNNVGQIKLNIPGLGEVTNAQQRVSDAVNNGENPWMAALKETPTAIFDTLFALGMATKVLGPRPVEIMKGNAPEGITTAEQPKSFREYKPPVATAPVPTNVLEKIAQEKGIDLPKNYDPKSPTYFKMESNSNGKITGSIIQIKPSYLDTFLNALKGDANKVPSNQAIVIYDQNVNLSDIKNSVTTALANIKSIPNQEGGFVKTPGAPEKPPVYEGSKDLTVTTLDKLKGRSTVSKQFISDLVKTPDLKQAERDTINTVLETYPEGSNIPVKEFADKVEAELLPLERTTLDNESESVGSRPQYDSITLPEESRGNVSKYDENIYQSPVETSAGGIHFDSEVAPGYFGHTRTEDLAPEGARGVTFPGEDKVTYQNNGTTRRVIEVQSDLYQKGNLEQEVGPTDPEKIRADLKKYYTDRGSEVPSDTLSPEATAALNIKRTKEVSKLHQYSNPSAHFRMVREEIKQAAKDGKTKLQFPTGETAMKIEGLGQTHNWSERGAEGVVFDLTPGDLKVGKTVTQGGAGYGNDWIITDVLGDGKFKAVPKEMFEKTKERVAQGLLRGDPLNITRNGYAETFDISGKLDQSNPIYKFYEKDLGKYLSTKYGAKKVTDSKGVSWYEMNVKPEAAKEPVAAFKRASKYYPFGRGPKIEISKVQELLKDIVKPGTVDILFDPKLAKEGMLGSFMANKRMRGLNPKLKPVINLYDKSGSTYVRTAFHEAYHYLESEVFSKEFVAKLEKATLEKMTNADHQHYIDLEEAHDKKYYNTPERRAAEYRADEFAKEQTSKAGYKSPIHNVLNMLRNAIKRIMDAVKRVVETIKATPAKQGGFAKIPEFRKNGVVEGNPEETLKQTEERLGVKPFETNKSSTPGETRTPNDLFRTKATVPSDGGKKSIDTLLEKREGEIPGALHNESIGSIDLIWGKPTVGGKKGYGLAKIESDHPDVIPYLADAVSKAKIVEKLNTRDILETTGNKPVRLIVDHQLGTKEGIVSKVFLNNAYFVLREGLEPTTSRVSSERSTIELPEHVKEFTPPVKQSQVSNVDKSYVNPVEQRISQMEQQSTLQREALEKHPAKSLGKFANKNGELPEVLGSGIGHGKFMTHGDDIVTELGFEDSETARDAYADYRLQVKRQKLYDEELRNIKAAYRKDMKFDKEAKSISAFLDKSYEKTQKDIASNAKPLESKPTETREALLKRQHLAQQRHQDLIGAIYKTTSPLGRETLNTDLPAIERSYNMTLEEFEAMNRELSFDTVVSKFQTSVKKKVGILDYVRTPDRVLRKIGLPNTAAMLRHSYESYLLELPAHIELIRSWSKRVSPKANEAIFDYLDGQTTKDHFSGKIHTKLAPNELTVANEIKDYLADWADRLGLPADDKISHYITHIFGIGENETEFDEDMAKIIDKKITKSVYDPFLEKRLGKKGYRRDTWGALDAYVKRGVRKANMDPVLERLSMEAERLELSQMKYVKRLTDRVNMRPTEIDTAIDNTIKAVFGYRFGQRPVASISRIARQAVFRYSLGLNFSSAIKNLTQGVNTYAKLGEKYTTKGYVKLLTRGSHQELVDTGVLGQDMVQDKVLSSTKKWLQRADKSLFLAFELAEKVNRGAAYFGAKAKALDLGMDEIKAIEYAKKMVRDTQFQFGSIDTPVGLNSDIVKVLTQFMSYGVKQTEFAAEAISNKEWGGIIRYIVASMAIVYALGKVFNIKWTDFVPGYSFLKFGGPPALALPIEVAKAALNVPDSFGNSRTLMQKVTDVSNTVPFPAGIQAKKTYKGFEALSNQDPSKKVENNAYNLIKGLVLGPQNLETRKDIIQKIYDNVQTLIQAGQTAEATTITKSMSSEDYSIYSKIKSAGKTQATKDLKTTVRPIYDQVQQLLKDGKTDEANKIVKDMSPAEYKVYRSIKKFLNP